MPYQGIERLNAVIINLVNARVVKVSLMSV
jgi:hypothetical protein